MTSSTKNAAGALLVLVFLFSADLVRLHAHADTTPASDCAACLVTLAPCRDAPPAHGFEAPPHSPVTACPAAVPSRVPGPAPYRAGGLRDPPGTTPD